jgi:hypothetical protein
MISLIATHAPIEIGDKYDRERRTISLSSRPEHVPFQRSLCAMLVGCLLRSEKSLKPAQRMIGDENVS